MLYDEDEQIIDNGIKPESSQRYAHRLIQGVNINEEGSERDKKVVTKQRKINLPIGDKEAHIVEKS